MTSCGSWPSTVQPTDCAVPSTSFMVPENSLAMDLGLITLAAAMMSSMEMFPEGLDDEGGGGGHHGAGGLPVLDLQLDGHFEALPVLRSLGDVITDLLGREAEGADLGG